MQGIKRKIVYVTAYEVFGWVISSVGLALLADSSTAVTGPLALIITTIAVSWNFIYNCLFEFWESRQFAPLDVVLLMRWVFSLRWWFTLFR